MATEPKSDAGRKNIPVATFEEYERMHSTLIRHPFAYKPNIEIMKRMVAENKYDQRSITMLDIGAGIGSMEALMFNELGAKLDYIYAVEPNTSHCEKLRPQLESLGVKHDVDARGFSDDFSLLPDKSDTKFDFVLMSHSAYYFRENLESVVEHAHRFLKPGGKLLIQNESKSDVVDLKEWMLPDGHTESLTSDEIVTRLRERFPSMVYLTYDETALIDVDGLVRGAECSDVYDVLGVYVNSSYDRMCPESQQRMHDKVVASAQLVGEKYWIRCNKMGLEITSL